MAIQELSQYSLEHAIVSNEIVIIEFYAPWCQSCQAFAEVFKTAAQAHPEMLFATVNADAEPTLAERFNLRAVPTVVVFREKVMVFSEAGAPPPPVLEALLQQVQALDMDQVRADIAAQKT